MVYCVLSLEEARTYLGSSVANQRRGKVLIIGILTSSFQPASGRTPRTEMMMRQMTAVARRPTTRLHVAIIRTGQAMEIPMMIPIIALYDRDCVT